MFGFKDNEHLRRKDEEIESLKAIIKSLEKEVARLTPEPPPPKLWERGQRVKGSKTCGFDRSMTGTVMYAESHGGKVWVRRDRASSDVFYAPHELEEIVQ